MSEVTVSFKFNELSVQVKPKKGMSQKEIVELGKKELLKKMKEDFPKCAFRITEGAAMSLEEAHTGQLVMYKENSEYAVIVAVKPNTKHPVHVRTETDEFKAVPSLFELIEDEKAVQHVLDKQLFKKRHDFMWSDGDVGYFLNGGKVLPVVVGGTTRGKTRVYALGIKTDGSYFSLDEQSMKRIFETKNEAEKHIK